MIEEAGAAGLVQIDRGRVAQHVELVRHDAAGAADRLGRAAERVASDETLRQAVFGALSA